MQKTSLFMEKSRKCGDGMRNIKQILIDNICMEESTVFSKIVWSISEQPALDVEFGGSSCV